MQGFAIGTLPDPAWGHPKVARVIPKGEDPWGILAPLKGLEPWGDLIPVISEDIYDQAVRGYVTPLMKVIGYAPKDCAKKVAGEASFCKIRKKCINACEDCHPGPKMPDCWEAPLTDFYTSNAASSLARLWRDGIYVIVVGL